MKNVRVFIYSFKLDYKTMFQSTLCVLFELQPKKVIFSCLLFIKQEIKTQNKQYNTWIKLWNRRNAFRVRVESHSVSPETDVKTGIFRPTKLLDPNVVLYVNVTVKTLQTVTLFTKTIARFRLKTNFELLNGRLNILKYFSRAKIFASIQPITAFIGQMT
jgi:hypothetical protein